MAVELKGKDLGMTTTARASWSRGATVKVIGPTLLLAALAWSPCPASAADIPGAQLEPLSDELRDTLEGAGYPNVEFVVIVFKKEPTGGTIIDSFAATEVKVDRKQEANLAEIKVDSKPEADEAAESTAPVLNQFDFETRPLGVRAVVIHAESPGSATDCRRGGSCASGSGG
jgi:hypothetical protein